MDKSPINTDVLMGTSSINGDFPASHVWWHRRVYRYIPLISHETCIYPMNIPRISVQSTIKTSCSWDIHGIFMGFKPCLTIRCFLPSFLRHVLPSLALPPCLGQQVTQSLFPPFRITCEPLQVPSGSGFGVKSSGVVQWLNILKAQNGLI